MNVGYYQKPSKTLRPEKIEFDKFVIPTAAFCYNEAKTSLPELSNHMKKTCSQILTLYVWHVLLEVDAEFGPGNLPIAYKLPLEIVGHD